jgi:hypothetical protein
LLEIEGFDNAGRKLWASRNLDTMSVLRFDVTYNIEIDRD